MNTDQLVEELQTHGFSDIPSGRLMMIIATVRANPDTSGCMKIKITTAADAETVASFRDSLRKLSAPPPLQLGKILEFAEKTIANAKAQIERIEKLKAKCPTKKPVNKRKKGKTK